jgi:hypothetical protein
LFLPPELTFLIQILFAGVTKLEFFAKKLFSRTKKLFSRTGKLPTGDQKLPAGDQKLPAGDQKLPAGDQKLPAGGGKLEFIFEGLEAFAGSPGSARAGGKLGRKKREASGQKLERQRKNCNKRFNGIERSP